MSGRPLLLLVLLVASAYSENIIIPSDSETGTKVGLVLVGGASCQPITYQPLVIEMQNQFAEQNMSLSVVILEFIFNTPNPLQLGGKIKEGIRQLNETGMDSENIYVVAHSLGGVFSQDYLCKGHDQVKGLALLGSVILRKHRKIGEDGLTTIDMNINTTSVLGSKDGLLRISRTAEAFWHQHINQAESNHSHTIMAIEGLAHKSFMDKHLLPTNVLKNDLASDISQEQGYSLVGKELAGWVDSLLNGGEWAQKTELLSRVVLKGLVEGMLLEGNYNLKPPCFGHALVNPVVPTCTRGSPWVEMHGQKGMGGDTGKHVQVVNQDNSHRVQSVTPVHLPQANNTCDSQSGEECTLLTVTVSENLYEKADYFDTGFYPVAATEIKVKMLSRQKIQHAINATDQDFHRLDEEGDRCAEINQKAIDWALSAASPAALRNYFTSGRQLEVTHDLGPYNAGPLWIWTFMNYSKVGDKMTVAAPMMRTPLDYSIQAASGFHYCKLLSPFRALEYLYVDSLQQSSS